MLQTDSHASTPSLNFLQAGCLFCHPTNSIKALKTRLATYHAHIHTHPFNGPLSGTTRVSRYQKGKTNLDYTEARDSEQQWYQLSYMQVCTALLTDSHASTPSLSFLQAGCLSCHPTNSIKALKARLAVYHTHRHTPPFNGPLSGTTQVSQYQKSKTNLDFTEASDSEWQWH